MQTETPTKKALHGLIGEKLSHSFSPLLHARFADYGYSLMEIARESIDDYFKEAPFEGVNVTIPYKETAMKYCTPDECAKAIGCVNTLVKSADGVMGYNTDTYGFEYLAKRAGIDFSNAKVTVLGSGGTCRTAAYTASRLGAAKIMVVSRHPSDMGLNLKCPVTYVSYDERFDDCDILVNTTPVGMFPDIVNMPAVEVDNKNNYVNLRAVIDVIYNPLRTGLVSWAKKRGITATGGLSMLVAQGYFASKLFRGQAMGTDPVGELTESETAGLEDVIDEITRKVSNVVLTGMPASGKSTIGRMLAKELGLEFTDTDDIFEEDNGTSPGDFIREHGEKEFRKLEKQAVIKAASKGGRVIATGGGVILDKENIDVLSLNGTIIYLHRNLSELSSKGRPLSEGKENLKALYYKRLPIYLSGCDMIVDVKKKPEDVCAEALDSLHNYNMLDKEKKPGFRGDKMKILVINGPNLNMLGIREPDIYGRETYDDLIRMCKEKADELNVAIDFYQSNHEGDLVDIIQQSYGRIDGIVINPGAYTHTSVAILDALKTVGIPAIEVHISDVASREDFRQTSYIRSYVSDTVIGQGLAGYLTAIEKLVDLSAK